MRKAVLLGMLIAVGAAGVAYAAGNTTNTYIINAKVTPKKSGTSAHPASIATSVSYTVGTSPKGRVPNTIKSEQITITGVRSNTNDFPGCGSSRLIDPKEGPSTCPKGSKIGSGYFVAVIEKSGSNNPSPPNALTKCRVDLLVFNGTNHRIIYYLYLKQGQAGECPDTGTLPLTFTALLSETKSGNLVQSFTLPRSVRHPITGYDSRPTFASVTIPGETTKVKGKKVGLLESTSCPVNHTRQVLIRFSGETGAARTSTRLVACS